MQMSISQSIDSVTVQKKFNLEVGKWLAILYLAALSVLECWSNDVPSALLWVEAILNYSFNLRCFLS